MSLQWQTKAVIMYMCNDLKLSSDEMFTRTRQILSRTIYLLYLCSDCNLAREAVVSQNCMHYSAHRAGWIPSSLSFHLTLPTLCPTSRPSLCMWQQKFTRGSQLHGKKNHRMKRHCLPCDSCAGSVSTPSCPAVTMTAVSVTFLLHWTKVMWGYRRGVWRCPQCGPGDSGRPVSSRLASARSRWWLIASVLIILDSLHSSHQIWNMKLSPNVWSASLVESFSVQLFTEIHVIATDNQSWQMRDTVNFSSSSSSVKF